MGLYERILLARGQSAASEILSRVGDLERAYSERRELLGDAKRRLDDVEWQLGELDGSARPPSQGDPAWQDHPDPDRAALDWLDFVVGVAGPGALGPFLDHYRGLGWITADEHAWFMGLARTFVPPSALACLPSDPKVLESVSARTRALLKRLRPGRA